LRIKHLYRYVTTAKFLRQYPEEEGRTPLF